MRSSKITAFQIEKIVSWNKKMFLDFHQRSPFFVLALLFVLCSCVFISPYYSLFLCVFIWLFSKNIWSFIYWILFSSTFVSYIHFAGIMVSNSSSAVPKQNVVFHLSNVTSKTFPIKKKKYKGYIQSFLTIDQRQVKKIPAQLVFKKTVKTLPVNNCYKVYGNINWIAPHYALVLVENYKPIPKQFSPVKLRIQLKKHIASILKKHIKDTVCSDLLIALSTADNENTFLSFLFSRLGLQHILAISGFHFGILLFFLNYLFSKLFSSRVVVILLFCCSTAYFLFLGSSASIFRTWIMVQYFLCSKWLSKPYPALNALGLAALLELFFRPHSLFSIGFQLSYLACVAIFLFFPVVRAFLLKFFPKRTSKKLKEKWLCSLLGYLRETLSLNISITLLILPVLFFHFQKFPLISLYYNFIIPPMIFVIMGLLILFFLTLPLPYLFIPIKSALLLVTQFTLQWIKYPPPLLIGTVYSHLLNPVILPISYLMASFILLAILQYRRLHETSLAYLH